MIAPAIAPPGRVMAARINLVANFAGRIWSGLFSFLLVPVYVKLMGIEAFGLVGFYTSLLGLFALFDLGMSATITRELASTDRDDETAQRSRDLVKTMRVVYWPLALAVALVVMSSAGWLATAWLRTSASNSVTIERAISLMGIALAGQMLFGFYSAGLLGLQRHVACNFITAAVTTLRTVGAVLVLWLVSPTITAFFLWQAISMFAGIAGIAFAMRHYMPRGPAALHLPLLREVWHFAAGTFMASISLTLVHQTDKIAMSRMLSLKEFGYYAFAGTAVSILQYLSGPIFATFFSAFSRKVLMGSERDLTAQYHRASQVLAVAIIPAGAMLVFFPRQLVIAWTGDSALAVNAGLLISLLGMGMTFHTMATLSYSVQLAHGWTRLSVLANLALFVTLVPLLMLAVPIFGAAGAAAAWLIVNGLHLVGSVWFMHRRILIGEQSSWYLRDVLPAVASVVAIAVPVRLIAPALLSRWSALAFITVVYTVLVTVCAIVTKETRSYVFEGYARFVRVI
jgi:O-antigen/teichoic acid export membrane protein